MSLEDIIGWGLDTTVDNMLVGCIPDTTAGLTYPVVAIIAGNVEANAKIIIQI